MFGNALGNAAVSYGASRSTPNREQLEAGQRILDASTASLDGVGGSTDPLDFLRRTDSFQSALDKLGSDATVLYESAIFALTENAENGMGMSFDFGRGDISLSIDETAIMAQFLEQSGALTYDANGDVAASMALVARSGATLDEVGSAIRSTLGNFVTDWDIGGLTQGLASSAGIVTRSGALNLMQLQDTVMERFNIAVYGNPSSLAALQRYETASVGLVNPYKEFTKTFKQEALDNYRAITGSIRERLIDSGYMPKRLAYSERMTGIYETIGEAMLGVIPAERLLAPLMKSIANVARGLLPQVAANSVTGRVLGAYQRSYDEAYVTAKSNYESGRLRVSARLNATTTIGNHADRIVTDRLKQWIEREGLSSDVLVNRRLRNPDGIGYRRPDVRVLSENTIIDGTIGIKTLETPQVRDFIRYSQGNTIIIVRPGELPTLLYAGGRP